MLSRDDFYKKIASGALKIYPLNFSNLTGVGYNLSVTYFVFSTARGCLLPVYTSIQNDKEEHFVDIPPNDTVLFFTREFIEIDNTLSGTFHSKVSFGCSGFGHISTTLDPTWKGQLIISASNSTQRSIPFNLDKNGGGIATMLLYEMDTPVSGEGIHDNNRGRCDLLINQFADTKLKDDDAEAEVLRLRRYILDEFATSLNGEDDYIGSFTGSDQYTVKVNELLDFKARLESEYAKLTDGEYVRRGIADYHVVKLPAEDSLLRGCTYVKAAVCAGEDYDKRLRPMSVTTEAAANEVLGKIKFALDAVEYELNTINHARRVAHQNERALGFASVESALSKAIARQKIKEFHEENKGLYVLCTIGIFLLVVYTVLRGMNGVALSFLPDGIASSFSGAIAGLIVLLCGNKLTELKKLKRKLGYEDE